MTVDIAKYEVNRKYVHRWYKDKGYKKPEEAVSTIAVAYGVPCIVCAYWIGEITDWPPYIIETIDNLIKFYGYTRILNKPHGSPL